MKRIIAVSVLTMVMFSVGSVYACHPVTGIGCGDTTVQVPSIITSGTASDANQLQWQTQEITTPALGITNGVQNQGGLGSTSAEDGSSAFESQNQGETLFDTIIHGDGVHNIDSTALTNGFSTVPEGAGEAFHKETQNVDLKIQTAGDGQGKIGMSGASMAIEQCAVVGAENGIAGAGIAYEGHNTYEMNNAGPNSSITQAGSQDALFITGVGVGKGTNPIKAGTGVAAANLTATQSGRTVALNNGAGTAMTGLGTATQSIEGNIGKDGNGFAGIEGGQSQTHSYSNLAGAGTNQSQWANGTVQTGGTIDLGNIKSGYGIPGN